jgi:hypothetical protein
VLLARNCTSPSCVVYSTSGGRRRRYYHKSIVGRNTEGHHLRSQHTHRHTHTHAYTKRRISCPRSVPPCPSASCLVAKSRRIWRIPPPEFSAEVPKQGSRHESPPQNGSTSLSYASSAPLWVQQQRAHHRECCGIRVPKPPQLTRRQIPPGTWRPSQPTNCAASQLTGLRDVPDIQSRYKSTRHPIQVQEYQTSNPRTRVPDIEPRYHQGITEAPAAACPNSAGVKAPHASSQRQLTHVIVLDASLRQAPVYTQAACAQTQEMRLQACLSEREGYTRQNKKPWSC